MRGLLFLFPAGNSAGTGNSISNNVSLPYKPGQLACFHY